ncbi:MAG: 23S rRNA (uracil(1939)-C(5))-methyltransferase RlmD [Calditrichaeota bacterium]|nr:23S rRNA (uracil(1939)-C(5))-methyltransferase RlmD [Calditrichota bacterium]
MAKRKKRKRGNGLALSEPIVRIRTKIEFLNEKGAGVAFHQRHKLTVEKTLPGEEVLVEYRPERPRKDRIVLKKLLEQAPDRVEPPCPFFDECGGCHLQHMAYPLQLRFKQQIIQRLLLAYPSLRSVKVAPVVGMPEPFYYRNKTQMPFQIKGDQVIYGLYRSGTHFLVPIDRCLVESRDANAVLRIIRDWANRSNIPIYDERAHEGILRHVVVRKGMFTNQVMVILVVTTQEVPNWKGALQELKNHLPGLTSVYLNIQPRRTNVILGPENILIWGEPFIYEKIGPLTFRIYPNTFFQINSVQTVRLLEKLTEIAEFSPSESVLDLFSGVGTIALYIARRVRHVVGIESSEEAVQAAIQNAGDNQISNVEFQIGDAEAYLGSPESSAARFTTVIVDPPRKGLDERFIHQLVQLQPEKIVYVSCNPKTLVRDLEIFTRLGYTTDTIYPFDMFPQTYHVESLTLLRRSNQSHT